MKNILIEGRPGIGKTTMMGGLAAQLSQYSIGGFLTAEIREGNLRVGFRIETFAGDAATLAHVNLAVGPRVGKYYIDQAVFERVGVNGLQQALGESQLLLIDEIGKMELLSCRYRQVVERCLDSATPVIATVMQKPHPFADLIKTRDDVRLIKVTHSNREQIVAELAHELGSREKE